MTDQALDRNGTPLAMGDYVDQIRSHEQGFVTEVVNAAFVRVQGLTDKCDHELIQSSELRLLPLDTIHACDHVRDLLDDALRPALLRLDGLGPEADALCRGRFAGMQMALAGRKERLLQVARKQILAAAEPRYGRSAATAHTRLPHQQLQELIALEREVAARRHNLHQAYLKARRDGFDQPIPREAICSCAICDYRR